VRPDWRAQGILNCNATETQGYPSFASKKGRNEIELKPVSSEGSMKDLLIPLGLLLAALGVFYFVWAAPGARVTPGVPGEFVSAATTPPAADPPKPVKKPASPIKSGSGAIVAKASEVIAPAPEAVQAQPAFNVPPSQLAAVQAPMQAPPQVKAPVNTAEITVGMPAGRVLELLGNPDLKASRMRDGHLIETYVYTNTVQGDFISIQLSSGRVVRETQ